MRPDGRGPTRKNGVHETSPEGAAWADEPIKASTTERAAIALSGCPAMDVVRKKGGKGYRRAEECATGL